MGESNLGPGRLDSKVVMQWAVVFAVVVALLSAGRSFLVPLAVALLISNLLGAITNGIAKLPGVGHVVPKWVARLLSIVLLIGFFWVVYRILAGQSDGMIAAAPVYQERFAALIANVSGSLGLTNVPTTGQLFEQVNIGAILRFLGGSLGGGSPASGVGPQLTKNIKMNVRILHIALPLLIIFKIYRMY